MRFLIFLVCIMLAGFNAFSQLHEIFFEDFHNNDNRWPMAKNSHINAIVTNGRYLLEHKKDNQVWTLSQNIPFNTHEDFTITAKIHHIAGGKKHTYGLLFGALGPFDGRTMGKNQKGFAFDLVDKGHFAISEFSGGELKTLYDGKAKKAIKPMGAENVLQVSKKGDRIHFYINGKEVYDRKAMELHGYRIGFVLNQDTKLKVEYLKVEASQKELDMKEFFTLDAMDKGIQVIPETLLDTDLVPVGGDANTDSKNKLVGIANDQCFVIRHGGDARYLHRGKIMEDGSFSESKQLLPYDADVCNVTSDAKNILVKGFYRDGVRVKDGFSLIKRTSEGWTAPIGLNVKNLEYFNQGKSYSGFLADDGSTLMIACTPVRASTNHNLYVSRFEKDDKWSIPKSLGPMINAAQSEERNPILAGDGKTLYFSSNRLAGYGKSDIFVTRRLDDTWIRWSEPQNLGPVINTKYEENKFFVDQAGTKVYVMKRSKDKDEVIYSTPLAKEAGPDLP